MTPSASTLSVLSATLPSISRRPPTGKVVVLIASVCLGILLARHPAGAQVLFGSVVGSVLDPSAAPVPGASVTLTNAMTGQSRVVETNESGTYVFSSVPSGVYDLTISKPGFATATTRGLKVRINSVERADFTLQLGAVSESIQVSAQAAGLQTDRAEVRHDITSGILQNLPVPPGRNYQQLLVLVPEFTPPFNSGSVAANPSRALHYNVNGTSGSSNNVRIDGTGVNAVWVPNRATYVPTLESIEAVNVVTNSFDAEQGLAGSSVVNVQIRSGTNEVHGVAFEYHNNNVTKAKPFFLPVGERKPKAIFNQFGGVLGGPIRRDRLFYFGSFEATNDRQTAASLATVPTAAIRAGDMSESPRLIYDPASGNRDGSGRTPFAQQKVPATRIEPIVQKLIALTPQPTFPGALTSNYYATGALQFDRKTFDTKINWNPGAKFTMYGRLGVLKHDMNSPALFGPLGGQHIAGFAGFAGRVTGTSYSTSIAGNYVITPNLVVDGNFGWNVLDTNAEQHRLNEKLGLDFLGIPGTNGPRRYQGDWPVFSVSFYSALGSPFSPWPIIWYDPAWSHGSNVAWVRGSHNIRFGMEIARQHMNHITHELPGASGTAAGGFYFTRNATALRGGPAPNQFNSFADYLLGLPTTIGKIQMVPDQVTARAWLTSFYVRDQWQAMRKLTVSYGVRWEYFPLPTRADRGLERYDADTNQMRICGVGNIPRDCGVQVSKRLLAPRFGLAWRPRDTFVVRAGYGITNDPYSLARPMRTNYPTLIGLTLTGSTSFEPAGELRRGIPAVTPPDLGNGVINVPLAVVVNTLPDEFRRGYIQSWNFTLQKQFMEGLTGQVGYVATRQIRQLGFQELNAGRPGGGNASRPLFQRFGRTTSTRLVAPIGNTQYNALQGSLERRFSRGSQVQVSYTWSKSIGICCADDSDGMAAIQLPEFYHLNRALSGYDRPHNLQIAGTAELPFGSDKRWATGRVARAIAGGWQVSALFSAYSGTPFSVLASGASLDAPGNTQRADQVKPKVAKLGGVGRGQSFFDPLAFASVTTARFGTAGFNSLRGPGVVNLDMGLFREFRLTERIRLQFRAESYNATNTPHFANPGNNVSNLQLNSDGSIRSLGGYTEITSTRDRGREGQDERAFRFGLRFSF